MKKLCLLVLMTLSITCPPAFSDDYEVNADAANGYAASMAAYHYHGSYRAPTQEQNGYAASEARSRFGLNPVLVPKSSDDSEGDGGGRWGSGGSSRWRGSDDQSSGSDYWSRHFHNRCQPQANQEESRGSGMKHPGEQVAGALLAADALERYRSNHANQYGTAYGGNAGAGMANPYLRSPGSSGGNYQSSSFLNQYPAGTTALRSAVGATPVRDLLRNSEGGFNHIYTGQ
jgi:hypothetical protein